MAQSMFSMVEAAVGMYEPNQLIIASELYRSISKGLTEQSFYKSMERMTRNGSLEHITKGIYCRPKRTQFGTVPISEEEISQYYLKDRRGVVIGYRMYNQKGITTQVSKKMEILSTVLLEDRKTIRNVHIRRIPVALDGNTIAAIETLEILQAYDRIEDKNKAALVRHIESFLEGYVDDAVREVIAGIKYKKSTIAFMASILDYRRIRHSLGRLLSPMSDYKIPSVEVIYETT